jgi:ABC-type Na+ efflux pump permease subunit
MRLLTVAERELRSAARRPGTHRLRWITAAVFFVLLVWIIWASGWLSNRRSTSEIFTVFSVLIFFYSLLVVTAQTADCLSAEKREGTLGLLFLTNLTSGEIIGGKLCSHALASVYGLFAIFPMLGLTMLPGGITLGCFWRTVLALVNAIFFAVAAGFLASAVSVKQSKAVPLATGLALFFTVGWFGLIAGILLLHGPAWIERLLVVSPLFTLIVAKEATGSGLIDYWCSLVAVAVLSWTGLGVATWWLGRTWRDRPKTVGAWSQMLIWERWRQRRWKGRVASRNRLLELNPLFWLDSRGWIATPGFMVVTVLLVAGAVFVASSAERWGRRAGMTPLGGFALTWLVTGLLIHVMVLAYAATVASQRLAEDKQSGALELILSTPTHERRIFRGLWLAYARKMFYPATLAVLAHLFFVWQGATFLVMEAPVELPPGLTPGQLLWRAWVNPPLPGLPQFWSFALALRILLLALVLLMGAWVTLGWVGRWLGLRMAHPGFAPLCALGLLLAPPLALFCLLCYLADRWGLNQLPERQFLPLLMWVTFGIVAGHCVWLSLWAARHLRHDLRPLVASRFEPPSRRRGWRPTRRGVVRLAAGAAGLAAALCLIIVLCYGYQNWQSRRAWRTFQASLGQKGRSLALSEVLPGPVSDAANFARTAAFQAWVNPTPADARRNRFSDRGSRSALPRQVASMKQSELNWVAQEFCPLEEYARWLTPKASLGEPTNRSLHAAVVLQGLQPHEATLRALAEGARLPYLRISTNRTAQVVLQAENGEGAVLIRMQQVFQLRACARLAVDRAADAGEDLQTSLHLARLARQLPDSQSSRRVQFLVALSLQPLWEGLVEHRWSDAQLAAFQQQLGAFDLLADYTNAIDRVVRAYIEVWQAIPDAPSPRAPAPPFGAYIRQSGGRWEPRGWWFDHCRALHEAGQLAIRKVDVSGARLQSGLSWNDLEGLPLDGQTSQLLQQPRWERASPALVAFAQTAVNQAIIACALERYRLARGRYPDVLESLVPTYLPGIPNDILRGRPLIYQRLDDAHFLLRGVGPNGVDDRKQTVSDDWLWAFPTGKSAE